MKQMLETTRMKLIAYEKRGFASFRDLNTSHFNMDFQRNIPKQKAPESYQESSVWLRESNASSLGPQVEYRNNGLSKMKDSQGDLNISEGERYKHLCLDKVQITEWSRKLNEANEIIAMLRNKLLEKEHNMSSTLPVRSHVQSPSTGNFHCDSLLNRDVNPHETLRIPDSVPQTSSCSVEHPLNLVLLDTDLAGSPSGN